MTQKQKNVFESIENKIAETISLLETHATPELKNKWQKEWKGESFWQSGKIPKSSGVEILHKQNLKIELLLIKKMRKEEYFPLDFL